MVRSGAQLDVIQDFSSDGFTQIETGSQVSVGGAFNHTNAFQGFSITGSDGAGNRSALTALGASEIEASSFFSNGRIGISGTVETAISASLSNGATISPGAEGIAEILFDTTSSASEDHALQIGSGVVYEWELNGTGNDQINVDGDLVLSDFWSLEIAILSDFIGSIDASEQFTLFTYTGDLTANIDASGRLNQVEVNGFALGPFEFDATNVGVFDDGEGTVFLTGLAVSVPEPSSAGMLFLSSAVCFLTRRKRRA